MSHPDPIPLSLPMLTRADIDAVREVMQSGWLTTGKKCALFEATLQSLFQRRCIAVSSATAGLHLALKACGIGPGDRVLVPTWTFTATAEAVEMAGAEPVFCDVDPVTLNMTGETARDWSTHAAIPVHMAGRACDLDAIAMALPGAIIIEDAAHAFGACYAHGALIGGHMPTCSSATVFSFYATKGLTTLGEGGLITSGRSDVCDKIRRMRFHGIDTEAWDRNVTGAIGFDVTGPGFKYNMSDAQAAMGLTQLPMQDEWLRARTALAGHYYTQLSGLTVELPDPLVKGHSWHLYQIKLPQANAEQFVGFMQARGIACGIHYRPLHRCTYWREKYNLRPEQFPGAESVAGRVVSLPMWPGLTLSQLYRVCDAVREFFK